MTYRDLDSFYREDLRRGRSRESDFGVWHRGQVSLRATWLEETGELYALTLTGARAGRVGLLAELPPSGHPNPRRSDLIAEAALAGWAERSAGHGHTRGSNAGSVRSAKRGSSRSTGPSPAPP
jgi:hypothetical protein